MKIIRIIQFVFMFTCVSQAFAQETLKLVYQYYGYSDNPIKIDYIKTNSKSYSTEEYESLSNYFTMNEDNITLEANTDSLIAYHTIVSQKMIKGQKRAMNMVNFAYAAMGAAAIAAADNEQRKSEKAAVEAQREAQWAAQQQALVASNKEKYAKFQAMTNQNKSSRSSSSQIYNQSVNQGSYNDLLTSDPDQIKQVQMSVQQYGVQQTREAVEKQRASQYSTGSSTGGYGGQLISAVTEDRRSITIQVRDKRIGGRIIAYSLGADVSGKQQWHPMDWQITRCTSNTEFQYEGYINGIGRIYFNF